MQNSYKKIEASSLDFVTIFYNNLFEISPNCKDLFSANIESQKRKFNTTLVLVINSLSNFELLENTVFELGCRHARYGIELSHFQDVEEALILTLTSVEGITVEELELWKKVLAELSIIMIEGFRAG